MNGEDALQRLIESGILGALLVLAIIAIVFLYREVRRIDKEKNDERDARLNDMKEIQALDRSVIAEIKTSMQNLYELITRKNV